ncbi:galactose-binding domain-like protein [Aspergillus alliaceus]|uniref:Galactose-binding domain-like protein n=1 Tax=Petromyces alliaceus TaxID=209559 RepID=A0A5N7CND9_PETAA|nr:galactose-binding domain-like protein [Aspergillus alliaceus]
MTNPIKYISQNTTITLKNNSGQIRCNIYRRKDVNRSPILVNYGPYGKDIQYKEPAPGVLDITSRATSEVFVDDVDWAAQRSWSMEVGFLGISYYAGGQWRVASSQPKGLACMIPWGLIQITTVTGVAMKAILSNTFTKWWWDRQVIGNQYERTGRAGDLSEKGLLANHNDQIIDNVKNRLRDEPYYASREYNMEHIQVPLLSYLRFITGRNVGFDNAKAERFFLTLDFRLQTQAPQSGLTVVTGHIVAHLNVFVCPDEGGPLPSETDLFLTLRYVSPSGEEIYYTSTVGDPTPLTKGWTRVSMRKVNEKHLRHREYLPYCDYYSTGVLPVMPGEVYPVDVEIWLSNVVVEKSGKLASEIFGHNYPLIGENHIHFRPVYENYVTLPLISSL